MKIAFAMLAVVGLNATMTAHAAESAKVKIDSGALVGISQSGVNVFKGVPFAKPPVGSLRWAPPARPASWSGERDATKFSLPCPQPTTADGKPNGGGVSGAYAEDCLYLNVWAPANARNAPVMLWLYGGAGFLGAAHLGSYDGTAFAHDGVILVTVNYRLGALGNFAHPALTQAAKPSEPLSSYGLMDAIAGLQWVQRNIKAFGGNPGNVTLFGQSAGGGLIMGLLSAPSAKGLFHKVILQSANPYFITERGDTMLHGGVSLAAAEEAGAKTALALGLPGADATVEQLRNIPAQSFVDTEATRRGSIGYVIDGRLRTVQAGAAIEAGTAINVPVMVGRNNGEPGMETALELAKLTHSKAPTYLYQFTYVPEWKKAEQPNGAPHSAEIVYTFDSWDTSTSGGPAVTAQDRKVSARMHSCWVAFVKASSAANSLRCADGFSWPAYTPQNDAIAVFGETPEVRKTASIPPFVPPPRPAGG